MFSDPSGMQAVPTAFNTDSYINNPEGSAWLADYYSRGIGSSGLYGSMGSGFYDIGGCTMNDLLGSLWNATSSNTSCSFNNVNGNWYHTSTSVITANTLMIDTFSPSNLNGTLPNQLSSIKIAPFYKYSYLQFAGQLTDRTNAPCQYVNGYIDWIDVYSDGTEIQSLSWKAVSGPWNGPPSYKGRVDVGSFFLSGPKDSNKLKDPGFIRDGVKFAFVIYNDILIHPDGNAFGSLGCVVLQENASRLMLFYNRTSYYMRNNNTINLIVSY
jgi:hypothetical protein